MQALNTILRRFSIRTRMLGASAMVLAMLALIGLAGLAGGLKLRALNLELIGHTSGEQRLVGQVKTHLAQVRLYEKQMVIDYENGVQVLKLRELWAREIETTRAALDSMLGSADAAGGAAVRGAAEQLAAYAKASEPVLQQIQNGAYDNARTVDRMLGRAKEHVAKVEAGVAAVDTAVAARTQAIARRFEQAMVGVMLVFGGAVALVVLLVVPLTLLNSRSITGPIGYARCAAQRIASGDLTQAIEAQGRDEASQLLLSLQQMQGWLRQVVGDVRQSSGSIELASREVAAGNADLSVRTEQTAGSLQKTAGAMVQLTGTVSQSADASRQASQLATSASDVARRGGTVVAQVVSTMTEINTSSKKIADITGTIDGIAFQTNILALNAAVEAARAGEQGRGFAVVASEVRSLAQRSAEAAKEIKSLIGASVDKVESGSRLVADAGSTMTEIVASVQRVADIIGAITAAAGEQSQGLRDVNGAVTQLDAMTQQNAALVEQSSAAAESLREQATRLAALVGTFNLGSTAAPTAA